MRTILDENDAVRRACELARTVAAGVLAMYLAPQIVYFFQGRGTPSWLDLFVEIAFGIAAAFSLWLRGIQRQVWRHTSLRDVVRVFQGVQTEGPQVMLSVAYDVR